MQHQNEDEAKTSSLPRFPRGAAPPSRELFLFSKTPETLIKYVFHRREARSRESRSKSLLPVWKRPAALHIPSGSSMYAFHHTSPEQCPTCATGLEYSGSVSAQHSKASEDLAKSNLGGHLLTANKSSCLWGNLGREEATGWKQLAQQSHDWHFLFTFV